MKLFSAVVRVFFKADRRGCRSGLAPEERQAGDWCLESGMGWSKGKKMIFFF